MPDHSVSRRTVAMAMAGGALLAPLASLDASGAVEEHPSTGENASGETRALLSPLAQGSRLLGWTVVAIEPQTLGTVRVQLKGEDNIAFAIEILARDSSPLAARPPAETQRFALFVSNGGNGRLPTAEEQGLAAMALAQIVQRNEAHVPTEGFLTHAERIDAYPMAFLDHVDGSELQGPIDAHTLAQLAQRSPTLDAEVAAQLVPHAASRSRA